MISPNPSRMAAKKRKNSALTLLVTFAGLLLILYLSVIKHLVNLSEKSKCDTVTGLPLDVMQKQKLLVSSATSNPRAVNCDDMLRNFLDGKIEEMQSKKGFEKSFVTRTFTPKPFYWSTHKGELDATRSTSYEKGEYYEKQLTKRISETFDKMQGRESIFLDVGGNIGWFSLLAAAHGASKVYTFEPNPANIVRICESLNLNKWQESVELMMMGVSDQDGKQPLFKVDPNNPGMFSFDENRANKFNDGKPQKVIGEFELISLDSFAEEMGWFVTKPNIAFFKLDVEGFEPKIIKGAEKLFKSRIIDTFAMEMKKNQLHSPDDKKMMTKLFFESGYELYMHGGFVGPNQIVQEKFEKWEDLAQSILDRKYGENLLFRRI